MRRFRKWLQDNNMAYDVLELKEGTGVFVNVDDEPEAIDYLKKSKTSCDYNYICNDEWILFKFE